MKFLGFVAVSAILSIQVVLNLSALTLSSIGDEKLTDMVVPFDIRDYGNDYSRVDRDSDGKVDYVAKGDKTGAKAFEAMDFNEDGLLDDFYIYDKGALTRREIDSNFDGKIDLWMYIYGGNYVEAYERDTNFDGAIDIVKNFGKKANP